MAFELNEIQKTLPEPRLVSPTQSISGDHNVQVGRDLNVFARPPSIKKVIARREGSVSPEELQRIKCLIEKLAEGEVGVTRKGAFGKWGAVFLAAFKLDKREELLSEQMADVEAWFVQQRAIQTRGQKRKAPDEWRRKRIVAIKAAMNQMGVTDEVYYPELACRLRMKKAFKSLKDLANSDLGRIYSLVLRDARGD